ncbi:hypothetical protein GCM10010519_40910 [Streptomyces lactacystinicus]
MNVAVRVLAPEGKRPDVVTSTAPARTHQSPCRGFALSERRTPVVEVPSGLGPVAALAEHLNVAVHVLATKCERLVSDADDHGV